MMDASDECLLVGNRRFRNLRAMKAALAGRMGHVERHEAPMPFDSDSGFVIQQEKAADTRAARSQDARDFLNIVFDVGWQHVGEHGGQQNVVEDPVGKREFELMRGHSATRVVGAAADVGAVKPE